MDFKSWPLTFGALAAVLAVVLAQGIAPRSGEPEEAGAAPAAEEGEAPSPAGAAAECLRWCGPIRLYEEHFGLPAGGSLGPVVATASRLGYKLDVLIALIPDPVDAGLSYRSDEALEAIQRGFADHHFLFDRHWLPWEGEAAGARRHRSEPGALLFRRLSGASQELVLVLLVGETPKSGLHKAAFQEALALAERLHPRARTSGPVRILGPTFSGTAQSLRIALQGWLEPRAAEPVGPPEPPLGPVRFRIVTGSATAPGLEEVFAGRFGSTVVLERTVVPDDELERQAYVYLEEELGWDFESVALLSELDTGYGQGARNRIEVQAAGTGREVPQPRFLVEFPSHLARLRMAREKTGLRDRGSGAEDVAKAAPKLLDPSLTADDEEPADLVPQVSSLATASDDLALANQLAAVCREGVRYVGILATAIQDRLFLADLVRSHCPDVLLFTFDSHLLTAHPSFTKSMQGALVLTSHPLAIAAGEKREASSGQEVRYRRQYASELQQGIVLAVRRLLGTPAEPPRPWIAAVGQGQLWPVVRLEPEEARAKSAPSAESFTIAGTEGVAFKWITASGAIGLLAFWLWTAARPIQLLGGDVWMTHGRIPGARFFPGAGMAVLAVACGVLLVFYSLPLWNQDEFRKGFLTGRVAGWGLNFLVLALVYGLLIAGCARLLRPVRAHRSRHGRAEALAWIAGAVLLLLGLRQALVALWVLPKGEEFFYARAGDFASGLSPLVSLAFLLAAVYAWALLAVRRRRMSLLQGMAWPLAPAAAEHEPLATSGRLAAEVDGVLWRWFPGPWFWGGMAVALLLPLRRLWDVQPVTEPAAYGWVFLALVGAGFLLGAVAFYRFVVVWGRLERLLDLLCHTWLLGALVRNSGFFDWKPLRSFGWRMPRHKTSLLSAEALRTLTRRGVLGADGAALAPDGALDRGIRTVMQADRERDLKTEVRARQELQKWFAKSAYTLELARPQLPAGQEEVAAEIDRFLALRVVGWIRYVFGHLRFSLISAMVCGLCVLVGVSAYAFQPKRYLSLGIWVFLLAASLLTLRIFMRMDRNAVLSAIGDSTAGKVSFDRTFFMNLFTYVGIPVLGVVLTQFPAVGSLLGDWLQPLLRLLTAR